MKATDPEGRVWTVQRRWLPRHEGRGLRERLRQRRAKSAARRESGETRWYDWFDFPMIEGELSGLALTLLIIVGIVLLIVLGLPVLLALFDLVIVIAAGVVGVASRVLLRRPWTVEALSADGERHEVRVVGWRNAGDRVSSMASSIQHGIPLEPPPGWPVDGSGGS